MIYINKIFDFFFPDESKTLLEMTEFCLKKNGFGLGLVNEDYIYSPFTFVSLPHEFTNLNHVKVKQGGPSQNNEILFSLPS